MIAASLGVALGAFALPASAQAAMRSTSPSPASSRQPRLTIDDDLKTRLIGLARREFDRVGDAILHHDKAALVDFSRPSSEPRLFIVDMNAGSIHPYLVAHGRGSDPQNDGWLKRFSNREGSNASSRGAYRTAQEYEGKYGLSMRLDGLDPDNNNAYDRAIVIHEAWYAAPDMIRRYNRLGRSEGCFTVSPGLNREVIGRLGEGRLLFAGKLDEEMVDIPVADATGHDTPSAPPPFFSL